MVPPPLRTALFFAEPGILAEMLDGSMHDCDWRYATSRRSLLAAVIDKGAPSPSRAVLTPHLRVAILRGLLTKITSSSDVCEAIVAWRDDVGTADGGEAVASAVSMLRTMRDGAEAFLRLPGSAAKALFVVGVTSPGAQAAIRQALAVWIRHAAMRIADSDLREALAQARTLAEILDYYARSAASVDDVASASLVDIVAAAARGASTSFGSRASPAVRSLHTLALAAPAWSRQVGASLAAGGKESLARTSTELSRHFRDVLQGVTSPATWLGSVWASLGIDEPAVALADGEPYVLLSSALASAAFARVEAASVGVLVDTLLELQFAAKKSAPRNRKLSVGESIFITRVVCLIRERLAASSATATITALPARLNVLQTMLAEVQLPDGAVEPLSAISTIARDSVAAFQLGDRVTFAELQNIKRQGPGGGLWAHVASLFSVFGIDASGRRSGDRPLADTVTALTDRFDAERIANTRAGAVYRFLAAHGAVARHHANLCLTDAQLDSTPLAELRAYNKRQRDAFNFGDSQGAADTFDAIALLGIPGSLFESRFRASLDVGGGARPAALHVIEAAGQVLQSLRRLVEDEQMTVGSLMRELQGEAHHGHVVDMLQRRNIKVLADEFARISAFFKGRGGGGGGSAASAAAAGFEARLERIRSTVPWLQYRAAYADMRTVLGEQRAVTAAELDALDAEMQNAALDEDILLKDAQAKLQRVQALLFGLPPSGVRVIGRLRDAAPVLAFLRRRGILADSGFHDVESRALERAAADEHALTVLNQLTRVRSLVKPFLEAPTSLAVVCRTVLDQIRVQQRAARLASDAPVDAEPGGEALSEVVGNVVANWDFATLFFADGATDAAQAADTLARVRVFMQNGRYLARLDAPARLLARHSSAPSAAAAAAAAAAAGSGGRVFEIYLSYKSISSGARGAASSTTSDVDAGATRTLKPSSLLDAVRLAVLSQAATPDAATRTALGDFKRSYDLALRVAAEFAALMAAGHPDYQPVDGNNDHGGEVPSASAGPSDAAELARLTPLSAGCGVAHLEARLKELQGVRSAWLDLRANLLRDEPRLRLLGPRGLLHAALAVRQWRAHPRSTAAELGAALLPYVIQALPECVSQRVAVAQACSVQPQGLGRLTATSRLDAAEEDLRVVLNAIQAACGALGLPAGQRLGVLSEQVVLVNATSPVAGGSSGVSAAAASFARAYDVQLRNVASSAAPAGVSPAQVLWCSPLTTDEELMSWLDLVAVPDLVPAAAALGVQDLPPAQRQRLARAFVERRYRAGCSVYLIFAGTVGLDAFSSFPREEPAPALMPADARVPALLALRSLGAARAATFGSDSESDVRVIDSVTVVAGAARSGKSQWIAAQVAAAGAGSTVLRIPVHEGFSGSVIIARYRKLVLPPHASVAAAPPLFLHFDVYDAAADLRSLTAFLHSLISTGILLDTVSGRATLLRTGVRHRIVIELPALCALDDTMPGGPRLAWPDNESDDASVVPARHPLLPWLPPLYGATMVSVTPASFPLIVDTQAALVAHYLAFAAEQGSAAVPLSFPATVPTPTTPAAVERVREVIDTAVRSQRPCVSRQNGSRAAFVRALAHWLPQVARMRAEVARQTAAGRHYGVRIWAEPVPGNQAPGVAAMPDFYREMVRIITSCAAQLVRPSNSDAAGAKGVSLWPVFHATRPSDTEFLLCGGDRDISEVRGRAAVGQASDIDGAVTRLLGHGLPVLRVEGKNTALIRSKLAIAFGFSDATTRMLETMQDGEGGRGGRIDPDLLL